MTKKKKALTGEIIRIYEPMRREDAIVPKIIAKNTRPRTTAMFGHDVDEVTTVYGPEVEIKHLKVTINDQPGKQESKQ